MLKFDQENKTVTLGERLSFEKQKNYLTGEEIVFMSFSFEQQRYCMVIPLAVYSQFLQYMEELKQ